MHFVVGLGVLLEVAILGCFCFRSASRFRGGLSRYCTHCCLGLEWPFAVFLSLFYSPDPLCTCGGVGRGWGWGIVGEGSFGASGWQCA